jgi:hypothetical protein
MNLGERICSKLLKATGEQDFIKHVRVRKEGRVNFTVPISYLCGGDSRLTATFKKLKPASISIFHVDTIGELIVRSHLSKFIEKIVEITPQEYNSTFSLFSHVHFSMQETGAGVVLTFHVSLLHDILIEKMIFQKEG